MREEAYKLSKRVGQKCRDVYVPEKQTIRGAPDRKLWRANR